MSEPIPGGFDPTADQDILPAEEITVPEVGETTKKSPFIFVGSPEYFQLKYGPEFRMTGLTYLTINCPTTCELCCVDCALDTKADMKRTEEERAKINEVQGRMPDILAKFGRLGTKQVVMIGDGEPLFEPRDSASHRDEPGFDEIVKPLIETAHREGLGTTMFSTLTHLTPEKAETLHANSVSVMVSLHSLKPEIYKRVVTQGQPDEVYENIETLTALYGSPTNLGSEHGGRKLTRLGVNFTINKHNLDEVDADKEWAHQHGMQFVANVKMPKGRAERDAVREHVVGTEEQFESQKRKALEVSDTGGQSSLVEEFCGFGRNGLAFNTDGTMMICGYEAGLKEIMPNILELVDLPDEALTEFSQIMSDRELWATLESPCITRAEQEKRDIFMEKLEQRLTEFNSKYGL